MSNSSCTEITEILPEELSTLAIYCILLLIVCFFEAISIFVCCIMFSSMHLVRGLIVQMRNAICKHSFSVEMVEMSRQLARGCKVGHHIVLQRLHLLLELAHVVDQDLPILARA